MPNPLDAISQITQLVSKISQIVVALERLLQVQTSVQLASLPEDEAVARSADVISSQMLEWAPDVIYFKGDTVRRGPLHYYCRQQHASTAHQPPGLLGMEAIWRPIDAEMHEGNADDPIPFVYAMDVSAGQYYVDEAGQVWRAKKDMIPCVWPPAAGNEWERVQGETEPEPADEWPAWKQPQGTEGAYKLGDKVSHNGKHWICTQVNGGINSYEPGVWGWTAQV